MGKMKNNSPISKYDGDWPRMPFTHETPTSGQGWADGNNDNTHISFVPGGFTRGCRPGCSLVGLCGESVGHTSLRLSFCPIGVQPASFVFKLRSVHNQNRGASYFFLLKLHLKTGIEDVVQQLNFHNFPTNSFAYHLNQYIFVQPAHVTTLTNARNSDGSSSLKIQGSFVRNQFTSSRTLLMPS